MARLLGDLKPVYVVGVGFHPYQYPTDTPYVTLGLQAVREALADAGVQWGDVESSYIGTALLGILFFNEPREAARLVCLLLIVAGTLGLKLFSGKAG